MSIPDNGIQLTDDELSNKKLCLGSKILLKIIEREIAASGGSYTIRENKWLLELMAVSRSTIQRYLKELEHKKYIAVVHSKLKVGKQKNGRGKILSTRYIYTDRRKAGYRKKMLKKHKKPVEFLYQYWVLSGRMSEKQYVGLMRRWAREEQLEKEEEEHQRLLQEHTEWIASLTDEHIREYEQGLDLEPESLIKLKKEYLAKQRAFDEEYPYNDDLFDD